MRILTVSHFYESHGGGIERVAGHLCRQFADLGANAVWAASGADPSPDNSVEAVPLGCFDPIEKLTGLPMPIPGLVGVRSLSQQVKLSDAVIIHDALYLTSIISLLLAKIHGKRTILVQHIATIPFSSSLLRAVMYVANQLVTRPMLWAADVRVFISDTVRQELLGNSPLQPSELLFNGVDGAIFHPGERRLPNTLADMGASEARHILFVGRYVEKKGLAVLRFLARSRPDLTLLLVGTGPIRPREWGLSNVRDLGPRRPDELADLYRWADLLILPSVGEGYPLVIQEAMACGLPIVCGNPTDRADPEATRWFRGVAIDLSRPEESAQRCAEAIDQLNLTSSERAEMSRYALSRYNWREMAQRLLSLAQTPKANALA